MATSNQMQRLQAVLDAYGADPQRWPAADRAALDPFIAAHAEAQALVASEADFDRVLSAAPDAVSAASSVRVKAALFAQLEDEGFAAEEASGKVVPFARKASEAVVLPPSRGWMQELSVMAASLLIGFFAVSQGMLEGSGLDPAQLTVNSTYEADDVSAIALGVADAEPSEEDLL